MTTAAHATTADRPSRQTRAKPHELTALAIFAAALLARHRVPKTTAVMPPSAVEDAPA